MKNLLAKMPAFRDNHPGRWPPLQKRRGIYRSAYWCIVTMIGIMHQGEYLKLTTRQFGGLYDHGDFGLGKYFETVNIVGLGCFG